MDFVMSPSKVTPATLAPPRSLSTGVLNIGSSAGPSAPPGAEKFVVAIGRVEVEGGFPEVEVATREVADRLAGRRLSVAEIYEAAGRLQQVYADQGYVLVRVVVPPQRLVDGGVLKFAVVDGFIEEVSLAGAPEPARAILAARTRSLIGKRHVKLVEIERALLIAGDTPGVKIKSAITSGSQPGGVRLMLEAEQRLVTGTLSLDNHLPLSLSSWESNATLAINDALGLGEQAYLSLGTGFPIDEFGVLNSPLDLVGAGFIAPIGVDGLTLNPEFTRSRTRPETQPGTPQTIGDFERFATRVAYPLIRERAQTLMLDGALEYIEQENYVPLFRSDLNLDRYAAARADLNWQGAGPWREPVQLRVQISQGLGGRDAADAAADETPISRLGASPDFFKLNVDAKFSQPLVEDLRVDVNARAQDAFHSPVFVSEQFSLDGADAVSSFPSGAFSVDSGAVFRAELTRPFPSVGGLGPATFSPYLFAAQGWGALYDATAVETANLRAGGVGLGLRVGFDVSQWTGATAGVEFSKGYSNVPREREDYIASFSLGLHF